MSIRVACRHHGVGWHRIMGLVRAESARVAERRRARPVRVLLVDETSIRRRHRYVTVVACGDTGKVLAMIDGRTKASLSRFFRDQGAWWCQEGGNRRSRTGPAHIRQPSPSTCPTPATSSTGSTSSAGITEGLTLVRRELQRRPPDQRPPTYEPDLFRNLVRPPAASGPSHRRAPGLAGGHHHLGISSALIENTGLTVPVTGPAKGNTSFEVASWR